MVTSLLIRDIQKSTTNGFFISNLILQTTTSEKVRLIPNMPGGGPMKQFADSVHAPIVMVGIHYSGSHPHSPNENIRLADYKQGTYFLARLLEEY